MSQFTVKDTIIISAKANNYKNGDKLKVLITLLDKDKNDLAFKEDTIKVGNTPDVSYKFKAEDSANTFQIDPEEVVYAKGWIDNNGDGKIGYNEEVLVSFIEKYKIGIHSNAKIGSKASFDDGHSWISIKNLKTSEYHTYGLWTDKSRASGMVGSNEGVLEDAEIKRNYKSIHSEYQVITKKEFEKFEKYKNKKDSWWPTHTCADWASDGYKIATGINIDADDWLGLETPREISESINDRRK